jgi:two-component system response regulator NreC
VFCVVEDSRVIIVPKQQPRPIRVVIVDDHKLLRQGFRILLEEELDVVVVGDFGGPYAIDRTIELSPDVVLVDLESPNVEIGLDAIKKIKAHVPGVCVVALAGESNSPNLVYRAVEAGVSGYLPKDTSDLDQILMVIRTSIQGQPFVTGNALSSLLTSIATGQGAGSTNTPNSNKLTSRESDVLELVAEGYTNKQIANRLIISESTVQTHVHNILDKLDCANRVQAASLAIRAQSSKNNSPALASA